LRLELWDQAKHATALMTHASRHRRRRLARSKRLRRQLLRKLHGPRLSLDDARFGEDVMAPFAEESDGSDGEGASSDRSASAAPAAPAPAPPLPASARSDRFATPLPPLQAAAAPGELVLDKHGRVAVKNAQTLDYGYRVFDGVVGGAALDALREACGTCFSARAQTEGAAYSRGSTYWVRADADRTTLSLPERAALDIFDLHSRGADCDRATSGAEWWTLDLDGASAGSVAWHFDRDYALEDDVNLGPHVATVTYLTSAGAPTVVVPLVAPSDALEPIRGAGGEVFASLPLRGKHMSFDGRYLHAAPDGIFANEIEKRRVTLLVNVWLDWRPRDADALPPAVRHRLMGGAPPLDFARERRIVALPVPTQRCAAPRKWSFKAGAHKTRIALRLPGALVDAPDACVLFQGAPAGPPLVEVAPRA